ncbi:MAG TPA: NAD(P)-dependent oxidoreductase [Pseudolabrys sp.]|nr:NAD(P)-dependent oxidoreductase [Pseudolabrys sp.]
MAKPVALYYTMMRYQPQNRALLDRLFTVIERATPADATAEDLARTQVLSAPLGYKVDASRMAACPNLRAILSNTTGVPHIDMKEAARRGVAVCALHDEQQFLESITPTAEHTIGLMLAALRRLPAAHAAASAGRWDRRPCGAPAMCSRLSLGLVGYGRLGRKVADVARAMGMSVAWFDPYVPGGMAKIEELARRSHVLSIHAVANAETAKLVSRRVLETLPKGAVVVNTARGEILDTEALVDLLESGHLWAAALDVVDGEYEPDFAARFADSRVARYARSHDNLILTPHIGGSTVDAWSETERRVIEKAAAAVGLVAA